MKKAIKNTIVSLTAQRAAGSVFCGFSLSRVAKWRCR